MKLLFYLHHPAHFHLFRNTINILKKKNEIQIIAVKKDVLTKLLKTEKLKFHNIFPKGRKKNYLSIATSILKQDFRLLKICLRTKPNLLIGTSTQIAHIGKLIRIPQLFFNEDDIEAIPWVGRIAYPFTKHIFAPINCSTGKFVKKTIYYSGYHELAYLSPEYFTPDKKIIKNLLTDKSFFILRLSGLDAYHDEGKTGINAEIAKRVIDILTSHGNVYITSERELEPEFEKYRISINPIHMHHALYYADMYIGDSQTMTAEAAVLGTPALRFNDFVGKLSYLEELEHKYNLTYGIKTSEPEKLYGKIEEILKMKNRKEVWRKRREKMLKDKIDVTAFFVWFIENYPKSAKIIKKNPEYQEKFR